MFEITLSLPPSVNESYAVVNGRKILTKVAREWRRKTVYNIILIAKLEYGIKDVPIFMDFPVKATVNFTFPDKRKRDQSNYIKQLYDAIKDSGHIITDDSQIIEEHIYSRIEKGKREVTIKIETLHD